MRTTVTKNCKIVLENPTQGNLIGKKLIEFANKNKNILYCIDTAHYYAGGDNLDQVDFKDK